MTKSQPNTSARGGLTLIEIIVCVGCLLLLAVLLIPWLLSSRGVSRDKLCMTRAKAVAEAVIAYADENQNQLPYLVEETGWTIAVTPYMNLPGAMRDGKLLGDAELKTLRVPLFVCPDDPRASDEIGSLSYVMNAGYGEFPVDAKTKAVSETGTHTAGIDWDHDGEITAEDWSIGYATGMCWRPDPRGPPDAFRMSFPYVVRHDGAAFTLLLSENLNAGTWLSKDTMDLAFVIGVDQLTFAKPPERAGPLQITALDLGPFAINANLGTLSGQCPGPSSLHGDFAHVMFCDGSGRALSAKVDPRVYAGMMTPNGSQYGQSGNESAVPADAVD